METLMCAFVVDTFSTELCVDARCLVYFILTGVYQHKFSSLCVFYV